jgi:ATP-dependent DNA ligase
MASKSVNITNFKTELPGAVDPTDSTTYAFEQVKGKNSRGTITYWRIIVRVAVVDGVSTKFLPIIDDFFDSKKPLPAGAVGWHKVMSKTGDDGKVRDTDPTIIKVGKNIGKANATNPFTQALRDALSKHNKQKQLSAGEEIVIDGVVLRPPMLAQVSSDIAGLDYKSSIMISPKLNGVRSIFTMRDPVDSDECGVRDVISYSRTRHVYPGFKHIKEELTKLFTYYYTEKDRKLYLDGEMFIEGQNLQTISGTARKELEDGTSNLKLDFNVFDVFDLAAPDELYSARYKLLVEIFDRFNFTHIKLVKHIEVKSAEEVTAHYKSFIAQKYEGAMLNLNAKYVFSYNNYHSVVLLKIKPTMDAEFVITGFTESEKGKLEGGIIFICETKDKKTFNVNPAMDVEDRKKLFIKMSVVEPNGKTHFENNYKGKLMTVLYAELSVDGVPQQGRTSPGGVVIRDYE